MVVESQRQIESDKLLGKELTTNESIWLCSSAKTVMYLHLSAVGETPGLGVLVCKAWGVTTPNQEKGTWLPVGNNLQIQFYINAFGLLYQILHMWLIFNIVKICGAGMSEALSLEKYCVQSAVASLTLGAAIGGNTEIVPPSKLTAQLRTQAIVKPFTCNCCWGLRKWLFGEIFSPQHVVFWSHHRMRHFLMFLLPWGVRKGGQSNLSSVYSFPPPIRVRVLSHLTSVKRDELGYQIQVSSDIQVFLSQTSCSKIVCSFYSAAECTHLSISLFI